MDLSEINLALLALSAFSLLAAFAAAIYAATRNSQSGSHSHRNSHPNSLEQRIQSQMTEAINTLRNELSIQRNEALQANERQIQSLTAQQNQTFNTAVEQLRNQIRREREQSLSETQDQLKLIADTQQKAVIAELSKDKELIAKGLSNIKASNIQGLEQLAQDLQNRFKNMGESIKYLQTKSAEQFGNVNTALASHQESTEALSQITRELDKVLGSSAQRGQFGEELVENILDKAGMINGIHYEKQSQIEGARSRPDFEIHLPNNQVLYMDVKFPLAAYMRIQHCEDPDGREKATKEFTTALRRHISTLAKRDYATKGGAKALNQVIMFLPNEALAGFIFESNRDLITFSLENQIVMCSPMTLFAYLGAIRQATDMFHLESASEEILTLMGDFESEFARYTEQVERVEKQLNTVSKSFNDLAITRRSQLEKPLDKIRELREKSIGTQPSGGQL